MCDNNFWCAPNVKLNWMDHVCSVKRAWNILRKICFWCWSHFFTLRDWNHIFLMTHLRLTSLYSLWSTASSFCHAKIQELILFVKGKKYSFCVIINSPLLFHGKRQQGRLKNTIWELMSPDLTLLKPLFPLHRVHHENLLFLIWCETKLPEYYSALSSSALWGRKLSVLLLHRSVGVDIFCITFLPN